MDIRKDLGKRILALRNEKGLTQEELAERTGLSNTYIAMLETGKRTPSLEALYKLTDALNVRIVDILSFERPTVKGTKAGFVGIELTEQEARIVREASLILGKRINNKK